ncbi:hypothetical protein EZI54_07050 [Marinobacter halodurans]|uniref:Uncharacterized protein n=1 Tax=Marinobacter halodurans TaxID=2528979 RepID=A0ABY1ZM81_9GAMM|nr:hypothetical protein [Marinobacter halodurans]TBW57408.1 hypothetical protein EZI54_07050 [Marinobacter halodurans]
MSTNLDTGVLISQTTQGEYMIRIETPEGTQEALLSPEEFAKAVTGKYARGKAGGRIEGQSDLSSNLVRRLGEVAVIAADRAIELGKWAGDQNRGQFIAMMVDALKRIPESVRDTSTQRFIDKH